MRHAAEICPDLVVLPYEFDKYRAVRFSQTSVYLPCATAFVFDLTGLGITAIL
jgi:nucleotidyltransferase/DNA polymerase involved in DNA repair